MRPVLTAAEQRAADEAAMEHAAHEVLVERAGLAAAIAAARLLPVVYGSRVAVVCGPGSNGADGTVAARHLADRGATVAVLDAASVPPRFDDVDLVVDAAFGTGLSRPWDAPGVTENVPVLAVDLPSGVDPDTGVAAGRTLHATATVAMGSLKRGHLLADGAERSGAISVATLGIEPTEVGCALVGDADLAAIPALGRQAHKWRRAVVVVAGSPGMLGAPALACDGALAAQAGMVRCVVPGAGAEDAGPLPTEVVRLPSTTNDAADVALGALERAHALVLGPGLGRDEGAARTVGRLVEVDAVPVVLDADALHLVSLKALQARRARGAAPVVLTPHDGEYAALLGSSPGTDRFGAAARLAAASGCTVLLKGPTTAVASPEAPPGLPTLLAAAAGTPDLATPGTGDVLSGVLAALLARGVAAHLAAALAAHVHGRAGAALGATCRASALPAAVAALLEAGRHAERAW